MSAQAAHRTRASMTAITAVSWPIQFLSATFEHAQGTIIILFPVALLIFSTWFSIPLSSLMIMLLRIIELLGENKDRNLNFMLP